MKTKSTDKPVTGPSQCPSSEAAARLNWQHVDVVYTPGRPFGMAFFFGGNDENETHRQASNRAIPVSAHLARVRAVLSLRTANGAHSQPAASVGAVLWLVLPLLRARGGGRPRTI